MNGRNSEAGHTTAPDHMPEKRPKKLLASEGASTHGRLITDVRAGAEALALLRAGAIDGLSIGYRAVRSSRLQNGGRKLLEVELWEISLVTFPMLDGARVTSAEEPAAGEAYRDLAATLDEARRLFV